MALPSAGYPPFDSTRESRHDMTTFKGRVMHSYASTDVRTLFTSDQNLADAQGLLAAFKLDDLPAGTTDEDLWNAKALTGAILHPDTLEAVFPLFRFSAFAPVNVCITYVTLLPANIASFSRTTFIHGMNQSFNAAINFSNRNASSSVDTTKLLQGFGGAVVSSVGIALGAAALMKRANALNNPGLQTLVRSTLPFAAVASAGCVNVLLMRRDEATEGVHVYDSEGEERGQSKAAGVDALKKCCAARMLWTIPGMVGPPVIMAMLSPRLPKNKRILLVTELLVIGACLWIGVPPALAVFPQQDSLSATELEVEFQNLLTKTGKPVERLYFNKGL